MSDDTTESAREHADALVREHLARRGLRQTLAAMDSEAPRTQHAISSRVAVAKGLKMDRLVRRNKERDAPLASLLEMLCEALELNERPIRIEGGASNGAPTAVAAHALGAAAAAQPAAPALRTGAGARSGADAGRARALERDGANREAVARPEMLVMRDAGSAAAPSARFAAGGLGRADGDLSDRGRQPLDQAGAMLLDEDVGDVHDAYDAYGDVDARYTRVSAPRPSALPAQPRASLPPGVRARELGDGVAAELSLLFHGRPHAEWMASWARQGFGFSDVDALPFALRQRRGGTCGVIAAIQALLLRELLAASPPIDPLRVGREERQAALARALAGSLWAIAEAAAAERRGAHAEPGRSGNAGGGADCALASLVTFPARMALPPPRELGRAASVIDASSREQLEQCVAAMLPELQRTDGAAVIAFVYSAVLSAGGPAAVRAQIDSTGIGSSTLIGAHGYCTQELVNLVATGVALSNVFDGDKELDGMVMRGLSRRAPVGLLSLFERYGHVAVGSNLKAPMYPVWLAFMESHYTVVFAKRHPDAQAPFDLWYYDMLANQDYEIRVTLDPTREAAARAKGDLVPPLEDTLHTKWPGVHISWNGVDPLL